MKYATSGGTAITSSSVTFAAGETTKTVSVNITGDTAKENNETFNLTLSDPTGASLSDSAGTATIVNDDS